MSRTLSLAFALTLSAASSPDWVLSNFAERLEIDVSNPSAAPVETVAVVSVAQARLIALRFPGRLAIVVDPARAGAVLPSQADDLDGDGVPDEFVFPVSLGARETRRIHVYFSTTLEDSVPWPKRVHASHAYGYNHSTVALESESIGYRTYGGFFLDVQARAKGRPGLHNSLVGYFGTRSAEQAGRDILHIGNTLGLGGLFLRRGPQVFQPPLNMPDYAHKPATGDAPVYRVIATGPVRAMVEARMDHWKVGEDEVSIKAIYSIAAGEEFVDCRFEISPVRLSGAYEVGAGIRELPEMKLGHAEGRLSLAGTQTAAIGPFGMALYYDAGAARGPAVVATREGPNQCALFLERLEPGRSIEGRYQVAAAWSGSGIADLLAHLAGVEPRARARVEVGGFKLARTPAPERLDGEAH